MDILTDEAKTYWRRQHGISGFYVEVVCWWTAINGILHLLNWALQALVWILEGIVGA